MNLNQQSAENQVLTVQELSKRLKTSEASILKTVLDLGLNPDNLTESDGMAIAQLLTGQKPTAIKGTTPETPKSFSIEDSEDFVNWEAVEEELGDGALALVAELGLEPEAITQSDLAALRELALSNPVHQNLVDHIGAVGSIQEGFAGEHIRQEFEKGLALGEIGSAAMLTGLLQSQLSGLKQACNLQVAIKNDFEKALSNQLEKLGKVNKGTPDKIVQELGKQAATNQQNHQRVSTIRTQKIDVIAIKKSLQK